MLVYMLLNTMTEKAYVGQTTTSLAERVKLHWERVADDSTSQLHEAMRQWDDPCFWDAIVLQPCYDQRELDDAEAAWQRICSTHDPAVGYNSKKETFGKRRPDEFFRQCGKRGGDPITANVKPSSPLAGLSAEERREYFRQAGKRGAAKSKLLAQ